MEKSNIFTLWLTVTLVIKEIRKYHKHELSKQDVYNSREIVNL